MKTVLQEELDDEFACPELASKSLEVDFIQFTRSANGELVTELLCHASLELKGFGSVESVLFDEAVDAADFILGNRVHPNEQTGFVRALPRESFVDDSAQAIPSAQVEIANAEVGVRRRPQHLFERWKERQLDVVENPRHEVTSLPV
jgi:hypothetical protein